jgi:hypothetical protein
VAIMSDSSVLVNTTLPAPIIAIFFGMFKPLISFCERFEIAPIEMGG